jgi:hypothetical protein
MALSDAACRAAKPGTKLKKLSDAGGLQLWVQPSGTRLWRVAYRYMGKQKLLSIGVYPLFSLAQARNVRDEAHRQLAAGIDPSQAKKDERARRENPDDTFKSVALEFVAKIKREGRAAATIVKREWLLDFAYPTLVTLPP